MQHLNLCQDLDCPWRLRAGQRHGIITRLQACRFLGQEEIGSPKSQRGPTTTEALTEGISPFLPRPPGSPRCLQSPILQQAPLPRPLFMNQAAEVLTGLKAQPRPRPQAACGRTLPGATASLPQLGRPTGSLLLAFVKDLLRDNKFN